MRFIVNVFIVLAFLIISCNLQYASTSNKGHVNIEYRDNGTVRLMKGENLFDLASRNSKIITDDSLEALVFSFLDNQKSIFKINKPEMAFEVLDITRDEIGSKHILLQQAHNGIPLWGKQIKIHIDSKNYIYLVNGDYISTPKSIYGDFVISENDATQKAMLAVSDSTGQWKIQKIDKYYFVLSDGIPRPSYVIKVVRGLLGNIIVIIDAINGHELHRISNIYKP